MAEMLAFPLLFLLSLLFFRSFVAALLPAADRRARDRRHVPGAQHRRRARLDLDLRAEPDDGPGPRPRDRLQPVRRLAIQGGDRQVRPGPAGDEGDDGDLGAHRPLLLADGDRGARVTARLPAALPVLDGPGRLDRRDPRGGDLAHRAARGAGAARRPGQLAGAEVPAAPRRRRLASRRGGLLVPPLAVRHAAPRPDRRRERRPADRAGDPVPADQVHLARRPDPARGAQREAGRRRPARRLPAQPRHADPGRAREHASRETSTAVQQRARPTPPGWSPSTRPSRSTRRRRCSRASRPTRTSTRRAATPSRQVRRIEAPSGAELLVTGATADFIDFQ